MFPVGRPFFRMCPSLVTRKMAAVTKELATLVSLGIIRPLSRKLASPLHCVRNPTVAVSLAMISAGKTQSPTMTAIQSAIFRISTPNLEEKNLFQVDLVKYYHQIPVAKVDVSKTAITTPFGFFRVPPHDQKSVPGFSSA